MRAGLTHNLVQREVFKTDAHQVPSDHIKAKDFFQQLRYFKKMLLEFSKKSWKTLKLFVRESSSVESCKIHRFPDEKNSRTTSVLFLRCPFALALLLVLSLSTRKVTSFKPPVLPPQTRRWFAAHAQKSCAASTNSPRRPTSGLSPARWATQGNTVRFSVQFCLSDTAAMGVGRIFSRGGTVVKSHFGNSNVREKHFSNKKLIGKYQISKSKGSVPPSNPFRSPWLLY